MFGKAAPKKCLPRTSKRYQKITRTYRKRVHQRTYGNFLLGNFWKITRIFFTVKFSFLFGNSAGAYFQVLTPRNNHSLSFDRWREKLGNLFQRKLGNTTPNIFVMVLGNDQFTYIISHHHDPILEITEPILKKF